MMIVGQISNQSEAKELEFITKSFVVGNRARELALKARSKNCNKWYYFIDLILEWILWVFF